MFPLKVFKGKRKVFRLLGRSLKGKLSDNYAAKMKENQLAFFFILETVGLFRFLVLILRFLELRHFSKEIDQRRIKNWHNLCCINKNKI